MFCFFGWESCRILTPWPGIKPAPPAFEGEVLTTEPPGKTHLCALLIVNSQFSYKEEIVLKYRFDINFYPPLPATP